MSISAAAARSLHRVAYFLVLLIWAAPSTGFAQVSTHASYEELVQRSRTHAALNSDLFGDRVNLQDGSIAFVQDDLVLQTNGEMTVSIGRKTPSAAQGLDEAFAIFGADWEPNIPYIMGTYDTRDGWNSGGSFNRCSNGFVPRESTGPWPYYHTTVIKAHLWWQGININIPNHGEERLLTLKSGQAVPTDGKSYKGITKSGWVMSCLPSIKNGDGEGFAVKLPTGVTYYFDWMATRNAPDLTDGSCWLDSNGDCNDSWHRLVPRTDYYLYATKATDRFGNSVTYSFDHNHPNRIVSIVSSDGVRLDVDYNSMGLVSSVSANGKSRTYSYNPDENGYYRLSSITLPDSSKWLFGFVRGSTGEGASQFWSNECRMDPGAMRSEIAPEPGHVTVVTMTHPSGAKGEFKLRPLYHGTNNTPGGCQLFGSIETSLWYGTYGVPSTYIVKSIFEKSINGPGLSIMSWTYTYRPTWTFDPGHGSLNGRCSGTCPETSETDVRGPDGVIRRYVFGNSFHKNFGQLLSESIIKDSVSVASTGYSYLVSSSGQPFPDDSGGIPVGTGVTYDGISHHYNYGNPFSFKNRPRSNSTRIQDGVSFSRSISAFDGFVRPVSIVRASSLGFSRTEATAYHDNLSLWVLGQTAQVTCSQAQPADTACDGDIVAETGFDSLAHPAWHKAFGILKHTWDYNADGTLASSKDGRNLVTMLSNWYRGVPRNIAYPDGTGVSATVNPDGTLASTTDENGFRTCYAYDTMGRLAQITYPSETQTGVCDTSAWTSATFHFRKMDIEEHGLAPGHWTMSHRVGNKHVNTYYDALWRPVLEEQMDAADINGTLSQVVKRYDHDGRVIFQSYPGRWLDRMTESRGTHTIYDALGRVTSVSQDSEHGLLITLTEYLPGLQTRVTNPRGVSTVSRYQAWDQPSYDQPIRIDAPEQSVTTILRDVFGKPLEIRRSAAP